MREHYIAECKKTDRKITPHEKFLLQREEINRLFCAPKYRAMSYASLITIGVVIAVQMAMIIWADEIIALAQAYETQALQSS